MPAVGEPKLVERGGAHGGGSESVAGAPMALPQWPRGPAGKSTRANLPLHGREKTRGHDPGEWRVESPHGLRYSVTQDTHRRRADGERTCV